MLDPRYDLRRIRRFDHTEGLGFRLLAGGLLGAQVLTGVALFTDQPVAVAFLLACSVLSISRSVHLVLMGSAPSLDSNLDIRAGRHKYRDS
jgi:hypothetical protein